jgi:UDP-N-acetylglucosamine--N-acetylmuramyl-(pentapeptide) pyrophosphoryl-undecaprenol N-acetylglucosamine transferase
VPVLIFLPDIEPGGTIRLLRRLARKVALTLPESASYFPNTPTEVTGYPLRQDFVQATRQAGIAHFGLDAERPVLLVFGGSRGARSINYALLKIVPELLADGVQIIHVTGSLDWPDFEHKQAEFGPDYRVYGFLHKDMGLAQAAADLVVSRAGASILAEYPFFGLPSILVPYPHAWRYQKVNADYLVERGAALRLDDEAMEEQLLPLIRALVKDQTRLLAMRDKAQALARGDGARRVAVVLTQLAGEAE